VAGFSSATTYGWSAPQVGGVEESTGVVLPAEICELSELSPGVTPLSEATSPKRGYVSSFSNFPGAGWSGKVLKVSKVIK
jgi:hypothetical protein